MERCFLFRLRGKDCRRTFQSLFNLPADFAAPTERCKWRYLPSSQGDLHDVQTVNELPADLGKTLGAAVFFVQMKSPALTCLFACRLWSHACRPLKCSVLLISRTMCEKHVQSTWTASKVVLHGDGNVNLTNLMHAIEHFQHKKWGFFLLLRLIEKIVCFSQTPTSSSCPNGESKLSNLLPRTKERIEIYGDY